MRLSVWNGGKKGADFRFIDRSISEFFGIGGTAIFAHLYLGAYLQADATITANGLSVPAYDPNNPAQTVGPVNTIQDPLLLENRDRKYSSNPIELRGIYNINDLDFDLRQFGLFLQNDTLYVEFHLTDCIAQCGRKLMPGDVLELPHRRDTGLDPANPLAANKYYLIEDASRASDGYSATWWPHIWRVKVSPMPASQEFSDILNLPATDPLGLPINGIGTPPVSVGSILSTLGSNLALNDAVDAEAKTDVPARYFETRQFWMVVPETGTDYPWIFAGDGVPPNGGVLLGSGNTFPAAPGVEEYYLRTDYRPETLFMWSGTAWQVQEQNYRVNWTAANMVVLEFINNDTVTVNQDGTTAPEKTALNRVLSPQADF